MLEKRNRKNQTRRRIATILSQLRTSYGYKIYKVYKNVFDSGISKRSIYYNLNKGLKTGEFVVADVRSQEGDFTWGTKTRRIYYALGPQAKLSGIGNKEINKIQKYTPEKMEVDWEEVIEDQIEKVKKGEENINSRKEKIKFLDKIDELEEWISSKLDHEKAGHYIKVIGNITSRLER